MKSTNISKTLRHTDLLNIPDEEFICFVDNNGKAGFKVDGKVVIEPIYDSIEPFSEGIALVSDADTCQFINKNGDKLAEVDSMYPRSCYFSEGIILAKNIVTLTENEEAALADVEKIKTHFNEITRLLQELYSKGFDVYSNYWYFDSQVDSFISDISDEVSKLDQYKYINLEGKEICSQWFDDARPFSEGFACVCKNGKWGYLNHNGEFAIPLIYDDAESFREGCASVRLEDGSWGAINYKGEEVVPFEYDYVGGFEGGIASVKNDGKEGFHDDKYGLVGKDGKEIAPLKYVETSSCGSGIATVGEEFGIFGLMNIKGELITPLKYSFLDTIDEWVSGVAIAMVEESDGECTNEYYGLLGIDGKELTPMKYSDVEHFKESRALVKHLDRVGFIDLSGREVVEVKYDNALSFSSGLAMVMKDGLCGYVNLDGEEVIPLQYECANSFSNNVALVKSCGKTSLINPAGEIVSTLEYDKVIFDDNEILAVKHNDKYGLIDSEGKLIVPIIYESAAGGSKDEDRPMVLVAGKWYRVDLLGNIYGCGYTRRDL